MKFSEIVVVEKRVNWENLRHDYGKCKINLFMVEIILLTSPFSVHVHMEALRFATLVPLKLPRHAATMSNYSISRNSVLSEQELLQRNRKDKELFRILKEARSMTRTISNNAKASSRNSRSKTEVSTLERNSILKFGKLFLTYCFFHFLREGLRGYSKIVQRGYVSC